MGTHPIVHLHPFRMLPPGAVPGAGALVRRDQPVLRRIEAVLMKMRHAQRRAVRIVDAGCGDGEWLVLAAQRAAALGFVAVEGRGFDADRAAIGRARARAAGLHDRRIDLTFDVADLQTGLKGEENRGADIVLCRIAGLRHLSPAAHERASAALSRVASSALICLGGGR
jgi:SAM-dependent methyltransferase